MTSMEKIPKIIVAGHVALDMTPSFSETAKAKQLNELIKPGKLINVGRISFTAGGCVTNTGVALHLFGADVTVIAKIGQDSFGQMIINQYREKGLEPKFIIDETESTSYTIIIAPPGCDRCFFHDSGANNGFKSTDLNFGEIAKADFFHFGYPTVMQGFYQDNAAETGRLFKRVKELGLVTSLDVAAIDPTGEAAKIDWEQALTTILPYVDLFAPSVEELCFMLDRKKYEKWQQRSGEQDICMQLSLEKDVKPLARKALSMGCQALLLKCGAAGMYLESGALQKTYDRESPFAVQGWENISFFEESFVPDRVLSGTGAGDTSIAAFLYGISRGYGPGRCLQIATGIGASCITEFDALSGLLPIDKIEEKIKAGWKKQYFIKP